MGMAKVTWLEWRKSWITLSELGVDCLWLNPIYPSPLRDDGYDISDYCAVHPDYGSLDDFSRLVEQAHRRGLRLITDLVMNHTV